MLNLRSLCALGLVLTALAYGSPALACKCAPHSVAQALSQAEAVFEGRVVSIEDVEAGGEPSQQKKRVTLSIVRVWKDLEDVETVTVTTNAESAACGFHFELDKSYLVYANRTDQVLNVHSCTRTRPMSEASEDLSLLGGGVTPVRVLPPAPAAVAVDAGPRAREQSAPATTNPPKSGGCSVSTSSAGQSGMPGMLAVSLIALAIFRSRARGRASTFTTRRLKRS